MGARLLQYTNRFTANDSYVIELKLGRMIPDICPHNLAEPDVFIPSQKVL